MDTTIDPTIKALASAIGTAETGASSPEAYTKKGASGEYGRYQFMPDTYKNYAQKYLGDANAAPTVENQNKIVYDFISDKKQQGYNPAQIASMWNAGERSPDAYKENHVGTNSKGVSYNTPAYVAKVSQLYQQNKAALSGGVAAPVTQPAQGNSFVNDVEDTISKAGTGIGNAINQTKSGEINPISGVIQGLGAAAGGVGGLANNVLEHLPVIGGAYKGVEGLIGQGANALANTAPGKAVVSGAEDFAQAHPEIAGDIGGIANIAALFPALKGAGIAKDAVAEGVGRALGKEADSGIASALAPKMTAKAYQKAALAGNVRGPSLVNTAGVRVDNLPGIAEQQEAIDTAAQALGKKPQQIVKVGVGEDTNNLNRLLDTTHKYAENVVTPFVKDSGVNYNYADLEKALQIVQPPKGLTGSGLAAWNRMKQQTLDAIASKVGPDVKGIRSLSELRNRAVNGKVPEKVLGGDTDFWDARKMIDDIYDTETKGKVFGDAELAGAKQGYKDLRAAFKDYLSEAYRYPGQMEKVNKVNEFLRSPQALQMNKAGWSLDDIEKQFGLTRSPENDAKAAQWAQYMKTLSGLYDAQRNIATKVSGERGVNNLGVIARKHPVVSGLVKAGKRAAIEGTGIGAAMRFME